MFEFLPHKWVKPDELKKLTESRGERSKQIEKIIILLFFMF